LVVHLTDIAFVGREHSPETTIDLGYVRGTELRRSRTALSQNNYGGGRYIGHPEGFATLTLELLNVG